MNPIDSDTGLEASLRESLAQRDPGPTPAWLRVRVAAAMAAPVHVRPRLHRFTSLAGGPVAATLTLAAVVLGVIAVAVVRSTATRPGGPPGGTGAPTPGIVLDTVRAPLALPVGWTILVGFLGVLVIWGAVETYLRAPAGAAVASGRFSRRRLRALVVAGFVAPILVLGQVVRADMSLAPGGFFEASLVHLEGVGTRQNPTATGQDPVAVFHYVPGGTVTFVQSVRNAGRLPITVVGGRPGFDDIELRLFAVHDPTGPIDVDTTPTYPFAPFELAPGEEREIVVVAHYARCPGVPVPSAEPSPDLSGDYRLPIRVGDAVDAVDGLGLTYSVLGFARDVDVPLYSPVVVRSPTGSICAGDPHWATPSPTPTAP